MHILDATKMNLMLLAMLRGQWGALVWTSVCSLHIIVDLLGPTAVSVHPCRRALNGNHYGAPGMPCPFLFVGRHMSKPLELRAFVLQQLNWLTLVLRLAGNWCVFFNRASWFWHTVL